MASYSHEPAILGKPKDRIPIVATATSVQTGSSPISQVVRTQATAINARLSTSLVETRSATRNRMGFVRDCGDSKEGSTPAAGWIGEINTIWAKGASNTLELARIVFRARRTMGYGAWARMWRSKQLPFGFSKAKMLVRIGEHLGDLDGQTFGRLPSGWSILYELSKLPRAVFEEFLREGVIHSGLKLPEAKALVAEFTGKQTAAEQRKANVRERLRRFEEFVHDTLHGWTTAERELARATLTQLTKRIGQPSSLGFGSAPLPKTAGCSFDAIVLSAADSQPDKPNPSLNL